MDEFINYYDLLGIKKTATSEEIKMAYKVQMKKWHPDINKDPKAVTISSNLNKAKEILLDETKRREYDMTLENASFKAYDKINKDKKTNVTTPKSESMSQEMYTKWEYFILYLKHYDVSILRKILSIILVVMESLVCMALKIINIIVAYFIYYIYDIIPLLSVLLAIYFGFNIYKDFINNRFLIHNIFGFIISMSFPYIVSQIFSIVINKNPTWINNLDMLLFKKSIGYK